MRLGEFRTKTGDCENRLTIRLSVYDVIRHSSDGYVDLDIDETLTIDEIAQKIYKEVNKSSIKDVSGIKWYPKKYAIKDTKANEVITEQTKAIE